MRALKWVFGVLVLAGLAVGGYTVWERYSRIESTDDAQVDGAIFPVSPRVAGHVIKVDVARSGGRQGGRGSGSIRSAGF